MVVAFPGEGEYLKYLSSQTRKFRGATNSGDIDTLRKQEKPAPFLCWSPVLSIPRSQQYCIKQSNVKELRGETYVNVKKQENGTWRVSGVTSGIGRCITAILVL